jgi:group I intron endonuclease
MVTAGIYLVTNALDGRVYVGQSTNIFNRWSAHKTSKSKHSHIDCAIRKYGVSTFSIEVLQTVPRDSRIYEVLNTLEVQFIKKYDATNPLKGYNITVGGKNAPISEETKKKMSAAKVGKSTWTKGKHLSEEHRKHLSEAWQDGKIRSRYKRTDEQKKAQAGRRSRPVCCIETGEIFSSVRLASAKTHICETSIASACRGVLQSAGTLHWEYLPIKSLTITSDKKIVDRD